ncbi:DNA-binding response regulator [Trichloromonas sp.]|uniref:DNA-binding response regulator n=1 Tax=Trichloromonas sp. TaxID=3069249 RepID=UPI002A47A9CE|nr:hypothetical protein [Trichloromonas sp.]
MLKKVIIVDEQGFSRICSALLELQGCRAECRSLPVGAMDLHRPDVGLVLTSYPYGERLLAEMGDGELPVLVLADSLSEPLLAALRRVRHACCMVKPVDYERLTSYIRQVLLGETSEWGGYDFV